MSSSDDSKLPTSTLARSFSAQLNDIFLLDETLVSKEKEVEQKKLELTQQNAELDALEARLKFAEEQLAKQSRRISLIISDTPPTPANTEVGNPLATNKSPRRRNPIPAFGEAPVELGNGNGYGEGGQDIATESASEPSKKDNPVVLQAPRALPVERGEIEARGEEYTWDEWDGGGREGGLVTGGEGDREAIRGTSGSTRSTFASPDVTEDEDAIQITFDQKLVRLSDRQGKPGAIPAQPPRAQATAQQQQPTFPAVTAIERRDEYGTPDPENVELYDASPANAAAGGHIRPDGNGDDQATGDLIDQYDYESEGDDGSGQASIAGFEIDHIPQSGLRQAFPNTEIAAASRPDRSDAMPRPVLESNSTGDKPASEMAPKFQEDANTKFLVSNLSAFAQPRPRPAGAITKTELPPLPGQTADIPKRKPVRGSNESFAPQMTTIAASAAPIHPPDRPPTPPSKAPRSIANMASLQQDYNRSNSSIASTPGEDSSRPSVQVSVAERGFGGLLKMKKSLQGLRKKVQTVASPVSPPADQQRMFSAGSPSYPPAEAKSRDGPPMPPMPPIPPEKPAATAVPSEHREPASPPPQVPSESAAQSDVFDRVQAEINSQQSDEPSPRKFEAKHKKAVEAIAKFSGRMAALRAMRKGENREGAPSSQEPPLAAWETERRTNQPDGPLSPPHSAYAQHAAQIPHPVPSQTGPPQSNGYPSNGFVNGQNPISPPQLPVKDDALPALPGNQLPPRPPSKSGAPLSSDGVSASENTTERPPRTTSMKPLGLSIFPNKPTGSLGLSFDLDTTSSFTTSFSPAQEEEPQPSIQQAQADAVEGSQPTKPFQLQLSESFNLAVTGNQTGPGLAPPPSPGLTLGRGGRTETYSFLGDYYFGGDDHQAEDESDGPSSAPSLALSQPSEPQGVEAQETGRSKDFRIKSFAPFNLGDLSADLSFDSFGIGESEAPPPPPVPKLPTGIAGPSPPQFSSSTPPTAVPRLPLVPQKKEPALPDPLLERSPPKKSLPDVPKAVQRVPSKPELRDAYQTPAQTVAHRSILTSSVSVGRDSTGSPPLPMKDIPEEGPYPSAKPKPMSLERSSLSGAQNGPSSAPASMPPGRAGHASSGPSSVRSSSGTTDPSAAASTPRTSLSSGINGSASSAPSSATRIPSGEQGYYPTRMSSSQGYQQSQHSPSRDSGSGPGPAPREAQWAQDIHSDHRRRPSARAGCDHADRCRHDRRPPRSRKDEGHHHPAALHQPSACAATHGCKAHRGRGPPMPMSAPLSGPGSRPGSRAQSPFRHPPVSHNFNGPPRGMPGPRRNSGGSNTGSRRPSMSDMDMDVALGMGQVPGQERRYRPPPQMRGGRPPPPGPMPPSSGGGGRGLKSLTAGGISYPGLDDFGAMDRGRMPAPSMPRREEIA
ncbi:hypothetical protein DRE_00115 [Drechslerella stenobrocha 248]|uniref:Uncharacterized protein n=1 Tax=Drechslerella stenobrocha 248 TaxID=1043628 RepID=W7IHR7_9PEZI|nr:hypothetical protein DRE_00115 [Drechslerella stenobrocha 248]